MISEGVFFSVGISTKLARSAIKTVLFLQFCLRLSGALSVPLSYKCHSNDICYSSYESVSLEFIYLFKYTDVLHFLSCLSSKFFFIVVN